MLDLGFNNYEGYLERVTEGTSRFINSLWIGGQYDDGGPLTLGNYTST